jgi:hypothetical protein
VRDGYTPFLHLDWGDKTCVHWYYHCMNALVIKDVRHLILSPPSPLGFVNETKRA